MRSSLFTEALVLLVDVAFAKDLCPRDDGCSPGVKSPRAFGHPSQWSNCLATTITQPAQTITASAQIATVTTTVSANTNQPTGSACLDDSGAQYFVHGFKDLLEYTSYNGTQGPPGRGYHLNVSDAILAPDFQDWSDSINWMAGFPLGSVTFASKAAFDYGQGVLQPELRVTTLNVWHSCQSITWRWSAVTASNATVIGINQMVLTEDLSKIQTNYAEFDNGAWLASFGLQCKIPRN